MTGPIAVASLPRRRASVGEALVYLRGVSAMLAMSVRMFFIAIVVFAVVAVGFLIATA